MTPLINAIVARVASAKSIAWDPKLTMITSPHGLLQAILESSVYLVEEAEFDTTKLRDAHPEHFATTRHMVLPADPIWIEFEAVGPGGGRFGHSAYLATKTSDGWIRVISIPSIGNDAWMVMHLFDMPPEMIGNPGCSMGKRFQLRTNLNDPVRLPTMANFFMELVEMLNFRSELVMVERQPDPKTQYRIESELGRGAKLKPWNEVRLGPAYASRSTRVPAGALVQ